jgi:hypothetical protein
MTHTFDIRFGRSAGLMGMLEAPANSFRWKGGGSLRIDSQGLCFAVKRGVLSFFPRTYRIPAPNLREVLREGEALRLEFTTEDHARAVLPFWARNHQTAERIVGLLPTTRTVELDHDASGIARPHFRLDWRSVGLLVVAMFGAAAVSWALREPEALPAQGRSPHPEVSSKTPELIEPVSGNTTSNAKSAARPRLPARGEKPIVIVVPDMRATRAGDASRAQAAGEYERAVVESLTRTAEASRSNDALSRSPPRTIYVQIVDGVLPIVSGMLSYEAARLQMDRFQLESAPLIAAMRGGGAVAESDWWTIMERIYNDPAFQDPELNGMHDLQLSICRAWIDYQTRLANAQPSAAFARDFAERLTQRADIYVR